MVSVLNQLCLKVIEIDVGINHDTDGILTRQTTTSTQADTNTTDVNTLRDRVTTLEEEISSSRGWYRNTVRNCILSMTRWQCSPQEAWKKISLSQA